MCNCTCTYVFYAYRSMHNDPRLSLRYSTVQTRTADDERSCRTLLSWTVDPMLSVLPFRSSFPVGSLGRQYQYVKLSKSYLRIRPSPSNCARPFTSLPLGKHGQKEKSARIETNRISPKFGSIYAHALTVGRSPRFADLVDFDRCKLQQARDEPG